jgi:hypothetical protein
MVKGQHPKSPVHAGDPPCSFRLGRVDLTDVRPPPRPKPRPDGRARAGFRRTNHRLARPHQSALVDPVPGGHRSDHLSAFRAAADAGRTSAFEQYKSSVEAHRHLAQDITCWPCPTSSHSVVD